MAVFPHSGDGARTIRMKTQSTQQPIWARISKPDIFTLLRIGHFYFALTCEIEEVLYKHPAVLEASVIGVPDEHWGEVPKAVIVPREGTVVTDEEIIKFCGEHLASFKKPKSVDFWKELPKSPQGKILKKEIRKAFSS